MWTRQSDGAFDQKRVKRNCAKGKGGRGGWPLIGQQHDTLTATHTGFEGLVVKDKTGWRWARFTTRCKDQRAPPAFAVGIKGVTFDVSEALCRR